MSGACGVTHRELIEVYRYEIARVLRRFCRDRRDHRLFHWTDGRALVRTCQFAGVPRVFFLCFLGRLAARGSRDLISSSINATMFRNRRNG